MAYTLVTVEDHELEALRPQEAFTLHIRKALEDNRHFVVVKLRADMPACVELLEAIERWVKLCHSAGRQLIVLPETADQFECLELSHPDQNIVYVPPGAELEGSFGSPEPAVEEARPEPPTETGAAAGAAEAATPSAAVDAAPQASGVAPVPSMAPSVRSPFEDTDHPGDGTAAQGPVFAPLTPGVGGEPEQATFAYHGSRVAISGEYECLNCQTPRTWLKGDLITDCENKECLNPRAGYRLTFDLF